MEDEGEMLHEEGKVGGGERNRSGGEGTLLAEGNDRQVGNLIYLLRVPRGMGNTRASAGILT